MTSTELRAIPTRALRRDFTIFAAAMAMETAHLLDDALLDPAGGRADVADGIVAVLMGVAAVAAYPRIAVWARAVLAGLFGLAGLVGGLDAHVAHAIEYGASGGDFSGFGHAVAGAVLLALAAALALRRRD